MVSIAGGFGEIESACSDDKHLVVITTWIRVSAKFCHTSDGETACHS